MSPRSISNSGFSRRTGCDKAPGLRERGGFAPRLRKEKAFALVATVALLVLVALVCLGLLSLSSLSLRGSQQAEAQIRAQANARLALLLALGALQNELGPDQRVSATAGIMEDPSNAANLQHRWLTGVWNSRNDTLKDTGAPDYDRKVPFRRWLVSSLDEQRLTTPEFAMTGIFADPVTLVGNDLPQGQAVDDAANKTRVQADRIPVSAYGNWGKGKIAWWVGDENCKGFINPQASAKQQFGASVADVLASSHTPGAYGMQVLDEKFPANTQDAAKVLTHSQLALASQKDHQTIKSWFHDLSPYPRSVLCNVAKGGLRQDLSLFLEQSSFDTMPPWPVVGGPTGPLGPNGKIALSGVEPSADPADGYDVLAWKKLAAWTRLRKNVKINNGRPYLKSIDGRTRTNANDVDNPCWNSGVLRAAPVPVRTMIFIGCGAKEAPPTVPNQPADPARSVVRLYAYPMVLVWNPYNVDLEVPYFSLLCDNLPVEHKLTITGSSTQTETFRWGGGGANYASFLPAMDPALTLRLKAGEAKWLSPRPDKPIGWNGSNFQQLALMWDQPYVYSRDNPGGMWGANGAASVCKITLTGVTATDKVKVETSYRTFTDDASGTSRSTEGNFSSYDIRGQSGAMSIQDDYYAYLWSSKTSWKITPNAPSLSHLPQGPTFEKPLSQIRDKPEPFMVVDARLKTMDDAEWPNKSWQDFIPGHYYQGCTNVDSATPTFASSCKWVLDPMTSYADAAKYMQLSSDGEHPVFGGSYFPAEGQSFVSDVEIPMAPLTSLAQLQHLPQASIDNLYSSGFFMQNHAIGNSLASPGVPADGIRTQGWKFWLDGHLNDATWGYGGTIDGKHFGPSVYQQRPNIDRSYTANHLLWDDYFFSSMAPKDGVLAAAGGSAGIDQVVRDFYLGGKPLPNERYRPYLSKSADKIVSDLIGGNQPTPTGYQKAAASLLVDGGFNVNSVSVDAWKALLASCNQRPMVVLSTSGGALSVDDPAYCKAENAVYQPPTGVSTTICKFNGGLPCAASGLGIANRINRFLSER